MTVERFFNENRVAIKVEMEIVMRRSSRQLWGLRGISIVPACFGTEGTKVHFTILDVEGFSNPMPLVYDLSSQ